MEGRRGRGGGKKPQVCFDERREHNISSRPTAAKKNRTLEARKGGGRGGGGGGGGGGGKGEEILIRPRPSLASKCAPWCTFPPREKKTIHPLSARGQWVWTGRPQPSAFMRGSGARGWRQGTGGQQFAPGAPGGKFCAAPPAQSFNATPLISSRNRRDELCTPPGRQRGSIRGDQSSPSTAAHTSGGFSKKRGETASSFKKKKGAGLKTGGRPWTRAVRPSAQGDARTGREGSE